MCQGKGTYTITGTASGVPAIQRCQCVDTNMPAEIIDDRPVDEQPDVEFTPEQHEKAIRALGHLNTILSVIGEMELEAQNVITDTAIRLLNIAVRANQFGPFALTLASAQMAVDLNVPTAQKPDTKLRLVDANGQTLQ